MVKGKYIRTKEIKEKIRCSLLGRKGKPLSEDHKQKISLANRGKKKTEEQKEKISKEMILWYQTHEHPRGMKGYKHSAETRKRMSESTKGQKHTEETKRKISEGNKGKIISEETRRKMSIARKGTHPSAETRAKLSALHKGKNSPVWKDKIEVYCAFCDKPKNILPCLSKEFKNHFCNRKCYADWQSKVMSGDKNHMYGKRGPLAPAYGNRWSDERKKKYAEQRKGYNNPFFGKESWNKNKTYLQDPRIVHGEKHGMSQRIGPLNPAWSGGTSFEPYTPDFNKRLKAKIKKRDGYCCMLCHMNKEDIHKLGRHLVEHHIDYNKKNSFPQNLITLCSICHGMTNTNRQYWTVFFHSLLAEIYHYQYTEDQKIILNFVGGESLCKQ